MKRWLMIGGAAGVLAPIIIASVREKYVFLIPCSPASGSATSS